MPASKWLPAALLLALPAVAPAQVYKCVDRVSGTSYQSEPCPVGQATAKVWRGDGQVPLPVSGTPGRAVGPQQATHSHRTQKRATSTRRSAPRTVAGTTKGSTIGACEAARRQRDRELAAMGKAGRKIETRRAADVRVASVCR